MAETQESFAFHLAASRTASPRAIFDVSEPSTPHTMCSTGSTSLTDVDGTTTAAQNARAERAEATDPRSLSANPPDPPRAPTTTRAAFFERARSAEVGSSASREVWTSTPASAVFSRALSMTSRASASVRPALPRCPGYVGS